MPLRLSEGSRLGLGILSDTSTARYGFMPLNSWTRRRVVGERMSEKGRWNVWATSVVLGMSEERGKSGRGAFGSSDKGEEEELGGDTNACFKIWIQK